MPTCPQCRQDREEALFQYPVKSCLLCYGALPWNAHLLEALLSGDRTIALEALRELRALAAKSKYAKKKRKHEKRATMAQQLHITPEGALIRATNTQGITEMLSGASDLVRCDGCGKLFEPSNLHDCPGPGDVRPVVCSECVGRALSGDLQSKCYLCQQTFPIAEIHVGDDNKWRCSECHERTTQFQGGV